MRNVFKKDGVLALSFSFFNLTKLLNIDKIKSFSSYSDAITVLYDHVNKEKDIYIYLRLYKLLEPCIFLFVYINHQFYKRNHGAE